jgi:hypothetical protein
MRAAITASCHQCEQSAEWSLGDVFGLSAGMEVPGEGERGVVLHTAALAHVTGVVMGTAVHPVSTARRLQQMEDGVPVSYAHHPHIPCLKHTWKRWESSIGMAKLNLYTCIA